jgi:hypothetical protein
MNFNIFNSSDELDRHDGETSQELFVYEPKKVEPRQPKTITVIAQNINKRIVPVRVVK